MQIILASQSPRRKQLLESVGIEFEIKTKNVAEDYPDTIPSDLVPVFLAEKKAQAFISEITANQLIISADTVVIMNEEIIGKPENLEDAHTMLQKLSGQRHLVVSGVCLLTTEQKITFSEHTWVEFKELTLAEINYYLQKFKPLDKAGSYGIQDWIGLVGVNRIEGCFYNVMGLPVAHLYQVLKEKFGLPHFV
jgi:septum formation protein